MSQCVEHVDIECLDRLLFLGYVHPFETAVDEGVVLKGVFRAPLAHWMRIAPYGRCCRDSSQKRSWPQITKDSTGVAAIEWATNDLFIKDQQRNAIPMSLWMHWWNAISWLRPAFSRLQTFLLWFATAVAGFTVRYGRCWA